MKQYIITITVQIPYPVEQTYNIKASNVAVATARALKRLRKNFPRKRIDTWKILIGCGGAINTV